MDSYHAQMAIVQVRLRVATTHEIPAYGGIRVDESVLHQIAEAISTGAIPMRFHHDLARPLIPTNVSAGVEQLEDGEFAVWAEFDADQDAWARYEAEVEQAGAPGGVSFTTSETFAWRGKPPYDITIATDAGHFPIAATFATVEQIIPAGISVEVAELFQFQWMPDPKVIIEFGMAFLASTPSEVLGQLLSMITSHFAAQLPQDAPAPTVEVRVHRTPKSKTTEVKISGFSDEGLRHATQGVAEILRVEGQAAYWDDQARQFRQVGAPQHHPDQTEIEGSDPA